MFMAMLPATFDAAVGMPDVVLTYLQLRRTLVKDGSTPQVLPGPWDNGYRATDPKLGRGMVARKGNYILGIFGTHDDKTASDMTSFLVNALK